MESDDGTRSSFVKENIASYEALYFEGKTIRNGTIFRSTSRLGGLRLRLVVHKPDRGGRYTWRSRQANLNQKLAWVQRRIRVGEDGWWFVHSPVQFTRPRFTDKKGFYHEDTSIFIKDNFWYSRYHFSFDPVPTVGLRKEEHEIVGYGVMHTWGHKRGSSNSCHEFYDGTSPAEIYVRGLVDYLNERWEERSGRYESARNFGGTGVAVFSSFSSRDPAWLSTWPSRCRPR